ncbi:hypothetical protein BVX98_07690 [bacterium F11]|nr:hypothetical protein BVX98_07690 [bacterium F11]
MGHWYSIDDLVKDMVVCPHCFKKVPTTAYCCFYCYKVINNRGKGSILSQIRRNRLLLVFGFVVCVIATLALQKWLSSIESHMTTIQVQNQKYNHSVSLYRKQVQEEKGKAKQ